MSKNSPARRRAAAKRLHEVVPAPDTFPLKLREWLAGQVAQFLVSPLLGMMAGLFFLFGGVLLDAAWLAGPQPLIDSHQYAAFTGRATGRVAESWAALEFDPDDMGQVRRWFGFGKITPCSVVEYEAEWGTRMRRAFCGSRFTFSDDFHLHDWNTLAPGVPFAFPRDESGFMLQEIRMSKSAFDWLSANPPYSTFLLSKPPPPTALGALKEQFDRPADVAVASWSAPLPTIPLVFDPQHPAEAMPAGFVNDRQHGFWSAGLVFAAILAVPGLALWRVGMGIFFIGQRPLTLWILTLTPLLGLPWWSSVLPELLRHVNRDWAMVGTDMVDDINRTTRLIASEPAEAPLADGERLVWRLNQGAYADTFGRLRFVPPAVPPPTADAALRLLREQASAGVRKLEAGEQAALFARLEEEKAAGLAATQALFTSAAEDVLRSPVTDPSVRRAARHFLSFAMAYNDWDLPAPGR